MLLEISHFEGSWGKIIFWAPIILLHLKLAAIGFGNLQFYAPQVFKPMTLLVHPIQSDWIVFTNCSIYVFRYMIDMKRVTFVYSLEKS